MVVFAIPAGTDEVIEADMFSCSCMEDELLPPLLVDAVDRSWGPSCCHGHTGMLRSVGRLHSSSDTSPAPALPVAVDSGRTVVVMVVVVVGVCGEAAICWRNSDMFLMHFSSLGLRRNLQTKHYLKQI